jgi:hypothetical protein
MCQNNNCRFIEIIEIHDNIKVVIHYDKNHKPILIEYWDEKQELVFKQKKV